MSDEKKRTRKPALKRRWFQGECERCLEKREVTIVTDGLYSAYGENDISLCRKCFKDPR